MPVAVSSCHELSSARLAGGVREVRLGDTGPGGDRRAEEGAEPGAETSPNMLRDNKVLFTLYLVFQPTHV